MNRSRLRTDEALACDSVDPIGIHCHIGSQILSVEPFARACEVMVRIAAAITDRGVHLEFIDLGGDSASRIADRKSVRPPRRNMRKRSSRYSNGESLLQGSALRSGSSRADRSSPIRRCFLRG